MFVLSFYFFFVFVSWEIMLFWKCSYVSRDAPAAKAVVEIGSLMEQRLVDLRGAMHCIASLSFLQLWLQVLLLLFLV